MKASYAYEKDAAAIYRRSFALIRAEIDLSPLPDELHALAIRLVSKNIQPEHYRAARARLRILEPVA